MTLARIYTFWKYISNLDRNETRRYLEMFYILMLRPLIAKVCFPPSTCAACCTHCTLSLAAAVDAEPEAQQKGPPSGVRKQKIVQLAPSRCSIKR